MSADYIFTPLEPINEEKGSNDLRRNRLGGDLASTAGGEFVSEKIMGRLTL
jgi:hypothetical protein